MKKPKRDVYISSTISKSNSEICCIKKKLHFLHIATLFSIVLNISALLLFFLNNYKL